MRRKWKMILICACVPVFLWSGRLISDRNRLKQELIRFHVVAESDAPQDQAVKLKVRDAVLESLEEDLGNITDMDTAKAYLQENLTKIRNIADSTLKEAGFDCTTTVCLCREEFDTRVYDTFTLPSGVYESLRIIIGEGKGHNWWCVAFPNLCLPATSEDFAAAAVDAGFSEKLTNTLAQQEGYEIRFFLLDALGRMENILCSCE